MSKIFMFYKELFKRKVYDKKNNLEKINQKLERYEFALKEKEINNTLKLKYFFINNIMVLIFSSFKVKNIISFRFYKVLRSFLKK